MLRNKFDLIVVISITNVRNVFQHRIDHTRLTKLLLVELFDVEYYRDLEMCVRDHIQSQNGVILKTRLEVVQALKVIENSADR